VSRLSQDQPVANRIFLAVPASEVGVGQFSRFHTLARRNDGNQFGRGESGRSRQCLPSFLPEVPLMIDQVGLPIAGLDGLLGFFHWKQLAPVSDQGHLNRDLRRSLLLPFQREARGCHFADQLTAPVVAPGVPLAHLVKRLFPCILVGLQQGNHLPSFELLLSEKFSRHPFPIADNPLHMGLPDRLFVAVEHVWCPQRQVLVASMVRRQKRMGLDIM
jgi:hypothetical protein